MGNELSYLPFYVGDFLVATMTWPADRVGAYCLCLWHQWEHGGVPGDDADELARVLHEPKRHAQRLWLEIAHKFVKRANGLYQNARMEEVRDAAIAAMEKSSNHGKKGAKVRWARARADARVNARALPEQLPEQLPEDMPEQSPGNSNQIQNQERTPLNPPSRGELVVEKDPTRKERTWAEALIQKHHGCPHEPVKCEDTYTCIGRLIGDKRLAERDGLRMAVNS